MLKMLLLTLIFTMFMSLLTAPPYRTLYIVMPPEINPYESIWQAVCTVESSNNPYAIGDNGKAYGIGQVHQCRLDDFYERTGIRFTLNDMFVPDNARRVFMYFADLIGPYDKELIIRSWNGSGPATYDYLKLVMAEL